jgi:hypothetical protein
MSTTPDLSGAFAALDTFLNAVQASPLSRKTHEKCGREFTTLVAQAAAAETGKLTPLQQSALMIANLMMPEDVDIQAQLTRHGIQEMAIAPEPAEPVMVEVKTAERRLVPA